MPSNRRDFLRNTILGAGMLETGFASQTSGLGSNSGLSKSEGKHKQHFKMSDYSAPKLDKVRIGFVGLGQLGTEAIELILSIGTVEIVELYCQYEDRVEKMQQLLENQGLTSAKSYSGSKDV